VGYFGIEDRSRRLVSNKRRTAAQLIQLLNDWQDKIKPYEEIVGDALEYLGFEIQRLAASENQRALLRPLSVDQ
jgi:hypothetical protein